MTPSEPCIVCSGCEQLVPLSSTCQIGIRRMLRCPHCDLVREWVLSGSGELIDLGARRDPHAEELAVLHNGAPLFVSDIVASPRRTP